MDWSKKVKDLTPEEIKERRDFLIQTLQVEEDYEDFIWEKTLKVLKKSNKYFVLASAMAKTRDYFDQINNVSNALDDFTIEIPDDEKIYKDVSEAYTDYFKSENDGRVFRDCDYNYDVIYSYVSSDFWYKYKFVRIMYTKECNEHDREINERYAYYEDE